MRGRSSSSQRAAFEHETRHSTPITGVELPRPPLEVQQRGDRAIVIPRRAWLRLRQRVGTMPRSAGVWLTMAGAFASVAVEHHDRGAVPFALLAIVCFTAQGALNRANGRQREDILREMDLHDPDGESRKRR